MQGAGNCQCIVSRHPWGCRICTWAVARRPPIHRPMGTEFPLLLRITVEGLPS
jgi:hypothetical protein